MMRDLEAADGLTGKNGDVRNPDGDKQGSGFGRGYRGGGSGQWGGGRNQQSNPPKIDATVVYNPPQRDDNCRVCVTLESQGDTANLYDEHTHNVASGCPRFSALGTKDRLDIARKAKLCLSCLDAEYIWRPGNPHTNCPVKEKKRFYSCKKDDCHTHFYVCTKHTTENMQKYEFAKKKWLGVGKIFACTVIGGYEVVSCTF